MISSISFNNSYLQRYVINPTVKAQLEALGKSSTGSEEGDLAILQAAKTSQNSDTSNTTDKANKVSTLMTSQTQSSQQGQPPWFSLMQELGISPTGSKDGDFAVISAKLSTMQSQATNEADKAKVTSLQSQFQAFGGQANSTPFAAAQNQVSEMNKFFLVNK
ncbi:MAG: hypothetical protein PHC34_03130 [Candidatus Gastranaerophilales bacterium]|nr:hypothetical protein [Candidatus Gastranaerophilales bacterium]